MTSDRRKTWAVGIAIACLVSGSGCRSEPAPKASGITPAGSASPNAETDSCAKFPPPFKATYLPPGFNRKLRRGAGLFQGTDYPTNGLLGYYRGNNEGVHVNFEVHGGPLPYKPADPQPLKVLGSPGQLGVIEGGFAVEFALEDCDFRMDSYGINRAQTVKVARRLREKH